MDRHPSQLETPPPSRFRSRRGRWLLAGSVVAAVGLLTALFGFGLSRDPTLIRSPLVGRPAPDFSLSRLDATGSVSLAALRGQVVVVNFWASWCAECSVEHAALSDAWRRYRDQGMVLVGIPFEDAPSASLAWQRRMGGGWPLMSDPGSKTAFDFGVSGVPETYVIGRNGLVAYKYVGAVSFAGLSEVVSQQLRQGP
jgi:cytochrome c biogenesis protein CcmG/thiol:disulfide interchange protein DsbE